MNDPYSILGVSRNASDDEIKEAYRRLAQKYSAADYAGDPLADLAAQRMRELNDAYDTIMAQRMGASQTAYHDGGYAPYGNGAAGDGSGSYQNNTSGGTGYATNDPVYADIRRMIYSGSFHSAEQRLLAIDGRTRTAEWYFLMGSVCQHKGWLDEAYRYYQKAASMDPANREYAAACTNMASQRQYGTGHTSYGRQRGAGYSACADELCSFLQCYCCTAMCCDSCCH